VPIFKADKIQALGKNDKETSKDLVLVIVQNKTLFHRIGAGERKDNGDSRCFTDAPEVCLAIMCEAATG
jgi:hypothetical protein